MKSESIEAVILSGSKGATVTGGGAGVIGVLTSSQVLGAFGFLIALAGLLVSWYYSYKRNLREEEEHQLNKAEIEARLKTINLEKGGHQDAKAS